MSTGGQYGRASGPRAGFWRRFAAYLIDAILVGIVAAILIGLLRAAGYAIEIILFLAYFTYFEGSTGQTLGKRALRIRVVDFNNGGSIGYGRGFVRTIGRYVSGFVIALGYLWMLWDREKQAWHDKFANSVVVPVSAYPVASSVGYERDAVRY